MKFRFRLLVPALVGASVIVGCGRDSKGPGDIPLSELGGKLESAFRGSRSVVKAAEAELAASLRENNLPDAFAKARALTSLPELTPEERAAASQALVVTVNELKKAADSGNKEAAEVFKAYISTR